MAPDAAARAVSLSESLESAAPKYRLSLFGRFRLSGPDGQISLGSRKLCGLLAFLACSRSAAQPREKIMALLWGSHFDVQARQNLRKALSRLRQALGEDVLESAGDLVAIRPGAIDCDAVRFEDLVQRGTPAALAEAVSLFEGEFLDDVTIRDEPWAEWLAAQRERLHGLAVGAMIRLSEIELRESRPQQALEIAHRAIALDNLREEAHCMVIRSLAAVGRRAEALKHFERLAALLKRELNVEPEEATLQLAAGLRQAVPAPDTSLAPMPAPDRAVMSFPPREPARASIFRRPVAAVLALALVPVVLGLLWSGLGGSRAGKEASAVPAPVAAPLPAPPADKGPLRHADKLVPILVLLTGDGDSDASVLAEQIAGDLAGLLARHNHLDVAPRETAEQYSGLPVDLAGLGARLGVRYVVSGQLLVRAEMKQLDVELFDVGTGRPIWSERFARSRADWPGAQEEILGRLTRNLHVQILLHEGRGAETPYVEMSIGDLSARGWAIIMRGVRREGSEEAGIVFGEALRRDPNLRTAQIGLAAYYLFSIANSKLEPQQYLPEAEDLLNRAAIGGSHVHALHFYFGMLHLMKNDTQAALQSFDRCLEINPNHSAAHGYKGRALARLGRYEEALTAIRQAFRLEPASSSIGAWHLWSGMAELELGRDQAARLSFREALAIIPNSPLLQASLAAFHALVGETEEMQKYVRTLRMQTAEMSDARRLAEFNAGPNGEPLDNRLGKGLRIALSAEVADASE